VKELEDALKQSNKQWFNAIVSFVGGVLLVFFSEKALEVVIMALSAVICCNLGMVEVSKFWNSDLKNFASGPLRLVIGVEFGLLGALVAHRGKDGILVVIAVVAAFTLSEHLQVYGEVELGLMSKWGTVALYSIVTIVFILVVIPIQRAKGLANKGLYVHLLTWVCPLVGGPLIMSSFWYFVTLALKDRDAVMSPWLDFLAQLLSPHARPVGLLTKHHFEVMNREIDYDRLVGYVGWFCLAIIGVLFQNGMACFKSCQKADIPKITSGQQPLSEALLPAEETSGRSPEHAAGP